MVVQTVVIMLVLFFGLRLWSVDIGVPIRYSGDAIWFSIPIKGMIEHGWVYLAPELSAPFGLNIAAFPSMTHTDWLIMKFISLFTDSEGVVLNVFWFTSIVLTGWTAAIALHIIGINIRLAALCGLVYAFLPFALLRNISHISLVYFCVPFLCLYALWLAQGCDHPQSKAIRWLGFIAAVAQGLDYIYYSFFAILICGFAGICGSVKSYSWKPFKHSLLIIFAILIASSLNLIPSFKSWQLNGKPQDLAYKSPVEAEVYALKIRRMMVPHDANQIPVLKEWAQLDQSAGFPNENENVSARLGPLAAIGTLLLLMYRLGIIRPPQSQAAGIIDSASSITLFALLFSTVGGFGAIFNLLIPDFRTYNRMSVFIAFFALCGFCLWIQCFYRSHISKRVRLILFAGVYSIITLSLYDQLLDLKSLRDQRSAQNAEFKDLHEIMKKIESRVPTGSLIFQLPLVQFPADPGIHLMGPYDHGKAYLASRNLSWSWPSFSTRHREWQNTITNLESRQFLEALAVSSFRLIWIDRFGYEDGGELIVNSLVSAGATEFLPESHPRYVILDLSNVTADLLRDLGQKSFESLQKRLLEAPTLDNGKGFYPLEHDSAGRPFRWSQKNSVITVRNWSDESRTITIKFLVASHKPGTVTVDTDTARSSCLSLNIPSPCTIQMRLNANSAASMRLSGDMNRINRPPTETRDLHFYIMNLQTE